MNPFEFILRLVGILVPAAVRKREDDAAQREQPLIDVAEEMAMAVGDAATHVGPPPAPPPVDPPARVLGVDVWHGYGPIDWAAAKAAGVRFAFAKCTQGNDDKDPRFDEYVAGAKAAGVPVGAYLYGYALPSAAGKPGRTPEEQARRLFDDSRGLGRMPGELPPVLDMEFPARWDKTKTDADGKMIDQWARWGVTAESIARWTLACLAELERLYGRTPILYTYPDFWARLGPHGKMPAFKHYPLWIATYVREGSRLSMPAKYERPSVPGPWGADDWAVWQFSADGSPVRVPGIAACPLDRNVMTEATLARLLA